MLVLTRKAGEKIMIGDDIVVSIGHISPNQVKVLIDAPRNVAVHREEIYDSIAKNGDMRNSKDSSPESYEEIRG